MCSETDFARKSQFSCNFRDPQSLLETLGGFHLGALAQTKLLASALARSKGLDENEVTSQFFGRLSLCLMHGNAIMLSSWSPGQDIPLAVIEGII